MRYLTLEQREALERQLRERASVLRNEIASALSRSENPDAMGLANHLEEIDDEAVADLETGIEVAEIERDVRELRRATNALGRIHTADFGLCNDCGIEIPYARLAAEPTATRCFACQTLAERAHAD